jgi:uncharacterized membrane protein
MKRNMGTLDRAVRGMFIAPLAVTVGFFVRGPSSIGGLVSLAIAVVMLTTAAVGYCPLYAIFGLRTIRAT